MTNVVRMANRICRVVRLRRALLNWRDKVRFSSSSSNVPKGHVAIYLGCGRRFLVHVSYLSHPLFVKLLTKAEEEFGFDCDGALTIPCEESAFEDVIRIVAGSSQGTGCRKRGEFRPLLQVVRRPIC